VALVELYDADPDGAGSRLVNISNRGHAGIGARVMIPGSVVSSEGPKTFLIRAVGPTLAGAPYHVTGTVADPMLTIYRRNDQGGRDSKNPGSGQLARTLRRGLHATKSRQRFTRFHLE
jgi:hypothetical protein